MSLPILLDSIICGSGLLLLLYLAYLHQNIFVQIGLAISFIGLGFQFSRNFGYLTNSFKNTIFDYGLPIWAFKELGFVLLMIAFLINYHKKK